MGFKLGNWPTFHALERQVGGGLWASTCEGPTLLPPLTKGPWDVRGSHGHGEWMESTRHGHDVITYLDRWIR